MPSPSLAQLRQALAIAQQIQTLEAQLKAVLSGGGSVESGVIGNAKATVAKPARKKRRKMSAEGKARIAAAQKARWAAFKKAKK